MKKIINNGDLCSLERRRVNYIGHTSKSGGIYMYTFFWLLLRFNRALVRDVWHLRNKEYIFSTIVDK